MVGASPRLHHPGPVGLVLACHRAGPAGEPDWSAPGAVTAWYHKAKQTFADCLALVRQHRWRARYVVNSAAEPEFVQCPREPFELFLIGQGEVIVFPFV